jgi:3-isopropylmalate/(R)-2-methylmalate dehydratase large subunit
VGHTLAEKILLAHADVDEIAPGDTVMVRCDVVMANDLGGPHAARELVKMGVDRVFDPSKVVIVADHLMPAKDIRAAELLKALKEWCDRQGVTYYDQGRGGIEHTVLVEEGWVVPGAMIVGADSHSCTYGALGAFGTGLGATDIAGAMALGSFWQIVPGTIVVEYTGAKGPFVTGKDLILALIAEIGVAGATSMALEFVGDGAAALSVDERLAVSNMAVEAGADTGIFPADDVTADYLAGRTNRVWTAERADGDAEVAGRVRIELDSLTPLVALPHSPGNVVPVADAVGRKVDQVYIGNCANGTITDLRQAAEILRGRSVHRDCRAILVPASQKIYRQALAEGLLDAFVEAGCVVMTPTCGACLGGHSGIIAAGETAITTTNRNFKGRMGSNEAFVHLANAWVAAAAAVAGEIVHPADVVGSTTA